MKAKLLVQGEMVNPFYSAAIKREVERNGGTYDAPQFLVLPVGHVIDDPDCWKLCLGMNPVMTPFDDECRIKVAAALDGPKRQAFIRNITRQNHPDVRKQMGKSQLEWLDAMIETHGTADAEPRKPTVSRQRSSDSSDV